jgi:hypothetical protein
VTEQLLTSQGFGSMLLVSTEKVFYATHPKVRIAMRRDEPVSLSLNRPQDFQEALRQPACVLGNYFAKVY